MNVLLIHLRTLAGPDHVRARPSAPAPPPGGPGDRPRRRRRGQPGLDPRRDRAQPARDPVHVLAHHPVSTWWGRVAAAWQAVLAGYHLATASVFVVDDYFFPIYVITPRAGTTIVQTWHGCGAFKKFGYSVLDKSFGADAELTSHVRIHSNYDLCLVSSMSVAPYYAEAFRQPMDIFRSDLGIPRTDVLFGEERIAATTLAVRRRYAIPEGRRVVLYAPTFRGDKSPRRASGRPRPSRAARPPRRRPRRARPAAPLHPLARATRARAGRLRDRRDGPPGHQ